MHPGESQQQKYKLLIKRHIYSFFGCKQQKRTMVSFSKEEIYRKPISLAYRINRTGETGLGRNAGRQIPVRTRLQSRQLDTHHHHSMHFTTRSFVDCRATAAAAAKPLQSCLTLCNPINGSPPGSADPGILQARTLEWVAISFSNA